jgi:two-component system, repressor protein LuxO
MCEAKYAWRKIMKAANSAGAESILIVEDDHSAASAFALQAEHAGYVALHASTIAEATVLLREMRHNIAAVILDLGLPDRDGLDLFRNDPLLGDELPVIVVTADGSINRAIDAMRLGAFDFLIKPVATARLLNTIKSALQSRHNERPRPVKSKPDDKSGYMGFVGTSEPMRQLYRQIAKVAPSRATVLISGESGTGKELCAEALHNASTRAPHPMVAINCGAIPENLLESQLFGHVKGSFTGAITDQVGAAQMAHHGTLFLDEICELELHLQVKLLRFIQTGCVQRVGSPKAQEVDVRIICATNRDPAEEVKAGRMREDLYYRLSVIPIEMPPLRVRGDDIVLLANSFLQRFANEESRRFEPLNRERCTELMAYDWPGNVRELQNIMRRAAVIEDGPHLDRPLITPPNAAWQWKKEGANILPFNAWGNSFPASASSGYDSDHLTLEEIERTAIDRAIACANGSLPIAARKLGISPSTLYRKRERWVASSVQSA